MSNCVSDRALVTSAALRYDGVVGIRGEIFSTRVLLNNRSYFFNIKENRAGDVYFNIVESKNKDSDGFERQSVIVFDEDLQEFLKGFDEALRIFEKTVRERKKARPPAARPRVRNETESTKKDGLKINAGKKLLIAGKKQKPEPNES